MSYTIHLLDPDPKSVRYAEFFRMAEEAMRAAAGVAAPKATKR